MPAATERHRPSPPLRPHLPTARQRRKSPLAAPPPAGQPVSEVLGRGRRQELEHLLQKHEPFKEAFYERTEALRSTLLETVQSVRDERLGSMLHQAGFDQPPNDPLAPVAAETRRYNRFCDWSIYDLVVFGACLEAPAHEIARRLAPPLLVFHAFRIGDDVVDGHEDYKHGAPTSLANLRAQLGSKDRSAVANLIVVFMMLLEASRDLGERERTLALRTLGGAIRESLFTGSDSYAHDLGAYQTLVDGKMISYGLLLYNPLITLVPTAQRAAIELFLARSFYVAQLTNDLLDREDDRRAGQANFWNLHREARPAVETFANLLRWMSQRCDRFPGDLRFYAHARTADLLRYTLQIHDLQVSPEG